METIEVREGKERKKNFEIDYDVDKNCFILTFDEEVFAISFFEHGFAIQDLLEKRLYFDSNLHEKRIISDCNEIVIDFSKTTWFDTLALCYLFLFIYDAKARFNDDPQFHFVLPSDPIFKAFLLDNGFYAHIGKLDSNEMACNFTNEYEYSNVHKCFFPFEVFDTREEIRVKLENIQLRMENAFGNRIVPERLEYLVNKLSYFLYETMENVFDHAYEDSVGRCGLLIKNVNCNNGIDYKQYSKKYTSKTPYIKINMFEDSDAYLEVYVMDTGRGLKKSFSPESDTTDDNIISYIFENGERSHRKVKHEATRYGGLHDIRKLFDQDADGLGIKADSVWRYVYRFNKKNDMCRINPRIKYGSYEELIHGFALVAAIHLPKNQNGETEEDLTLKENASSIVDDLFSQGKGVELLPSACIIDERWGDVVEKEWQDKEKHITVIYPPSISTKLWITSTIYNNKKSSLFFMEVPDAEIKKYQSNIEGIRFNQVSSKRIIVVTKSLNVSYYEEGEDGYYSLSKDVQKKFICTKYSDGISIIDSFSAFLIFDKFYNSWRFWDMALNLTGGFSYIPEKVFWSETKDVSGYLDFSQTNRMPECRDICIQKLNQLRVLMSGAYFNSVDRFSDEICERANFVVGCDKDGAKINIGSVFVSGTSNRLLDNESECFYFLLHPDSENTTVKSLLGWISPKFLPDIATPEESIRKFKRLGNSSFIARGGADYWLNKHYGENGSFIRLGGNSLYTLLQRKIGVHPDTLRIGHFESTERHDLFGYRINYWFDSDIIDRQLNPTYERTSIFDFLFTNFVYALKGKIRKEEFYSILNPTLSPGMSNSLWCKYHAADDCSGKQSDGILVYFFDFQTSMLVEKIEKLLIKEEAKSIIPLIPLSRTYEMGSLVISPLILDRIEDQIKETKKKGAEAKITVFESVAFNVRLVEEVKQILYGIGADQVRILTILDRRRIPVTETKPAIKALGRIDSPALHGNDRCTICRALEILEECKNQVINIDIKKRLEDMISRWQCVQLSDNEYKRGIGSRQIKLTQSAQEIVENFCGDYLGKPLKIELDSALCSMVVEHTVISASNQLLMRLLDLNILIESDIDGIKSDELKMLLASTYLLLFAANPISNKQIKLVAEILRNLLDNHKYTSDRTSLAVVAISSLPDKFIRSLCKKYEMVEEGIIQSDSKMINNDALIARIVSYMSTQLPYRNSDYVLLERSVRCYLFGNQSKLECLYDIFMYSEKSYDNSHRHAFARIIDSAAPTPRDYQNALEYSKKIKSIVESDDVYASLFHEKTTLPYNKKKLIKEIEEAISDLEKIVHFQADNDISNPVLEDDVKHSVDTFVQSLVETNTKGLYLRISSLEDSDEQKSIEAWLEYCLQVAKSRVQKSQDVLICFDVQKTTLIPKHWFYSFADVTEEVINLIVDILQYRDGKISWEINSHEAWYDGVISVEYYERYVEITFLNKANKQISIDKIRDIKNSKSNRDTLLVFKEFDRRLNDGKTDKINILEWDYQDYKDEDTGKVEDIYNAIMRIPYINRGSAYKPDVFEREGR